MDKITKMTHIDMDGLFKVENYEMFKVEMENQGFEVIKIEAKASDNHPHGFCQINVSKNDTQFAWRGVCLTRDHIYKLVNYYNRQQEATYIRERDILRAVEIFKRPEIKKALRDIFTQK